MLPCQNGVAILTRVKRTPRVPVEGHHQGEASRPGPSCQTPKWQDDEQLQPDRTSGPAPECHERRRLANTKLPSRVGRFSIRSSRYSNGIIPPARALCGSVLKRPMSALKGRRTACFLISQGGGEIAFSSSVEQRYPHLPFSSRP